MFAAWVNHNDSKSLNSLDMLVEENGAKFIKHHLIDFSAVFGAEAFEPKSPRAGYVPLFDWTSSAKEFFTLGLYVPAYACERIILMSKRSAASKAKYSTRRPGSATTTTRRSPTCFPTMPSGPRNRYGVHRAGSSGDGQTAQYTSEEGAEYLVRSLMQRRREDRPGLFFGGAAA